MCSVRKTPTQQEVSLCKYGKGRGSFVVIFAELRRGWIRYNQRLRNSLIPAVRQTLHMPVTG